MLKGILIEKTRASFICAVLVLSAAALLAEMLPEMEAKIFVIPSLIASIGLSILELSRWKRMKEKQA